MRKAQPARHTGGQLVFVDQELHGATHPTGVEPAGRIEDRLNPSVQCSERGLDGARVRSLRTMHGSDADLSHELSRQGLEVTRPERVTPTGRDRRRPVDLDEAPIHAPQFGIDIGRVALEQDPGRGPVPQDRNRRQERRPHRERIGPGGSEPAGHHGTRSRAQHHLGEDADRPERADEDTAEVEASHVLHHRSAGLHQPAFGRYIARLEQRVAHGAPPQPP